MLDFSLSKVFVDNKSDLAEVVEIIIERDENIVGKGENAGFPSSTMFSKDVFIQVVKSFDVF